MAKGIYKRQNSNFYWIRYAGIDGRIIRESAKTTSKREAEYLLVCRKKDVKEGKAPEIKKIKNHFFRDLVGNYLSWAERQKGFRRKKGIIGMLFRDFGNIPLRHFTTMAVEKYQTKIINNGKANATANRHLATLKHMFTKAVEWEMVDLVPFFSFFN